MKNSEGRPVLMDYCLLPYDAEPAADALASTTMLTAGLAAMGALDAGEALCDRIVDELGPHRTVWGIGRDHVSGEITCELYFYRRPHSQDVDLALVDSLLAPTIELASTLNDSVPWHMLSVELGAGHFGGNWPAIARIYSDVTGLSYAVDGESLVLENRYDFHHPQRDIDAILQDLRASLHAPDTAASLRDRLPPQLLDCYHVCVAQKRTADAVYFSRIDGGAFGWFLAHCDWPELVQSTWRKHASRLEHVRWDVGFSYRRSGDSITITKSGWYASF